ncbi:hypothetical protein KCP74_06150 [Salmonella enterica subsp. enterica]|nr:hypothetical protein KCP74_06150 [Salmonella enterica subsp. enterica]
MKARPGEQERLLRPRRCDCRMIVGTAYLSGTGAVVNGLAYNSLSMNSADAASAAAFRKPEK